MFKEISSDFPVPSYNRPSKDFPVFKFQETGLDSLWLKKIEKWCNDNCSDLWEIYNRPNKEGHEYGNRTMIKFISDKDALAFKLKWV